MTDSRKSCRLPTNLSFEDWVTYVFDHPILELAWWWQNSESGYLQLWDPLRKPVRTLRHLTDLFTEPGFLIDRFSRAQIDQGLNFIVSNACSDHMAVFTDTTIPWPDRRAGFDAMIPLYAKLMAPVYGNDSGRTIANPGHSNHLNYACYMWWDIVPFYGGMEHCDRDRINNAVLHVFGEVLRMDAEACLESVLHGLGHWQMYVPERTEPIAQKFLTRTDISLELRKYAEQALVGNVQ
ncbi:MAG: hypothetical protein HZB26_21305 [Candidatus Hydrogenedentes bacterium]|nr:hypothetical protein [Candidatus Hydrogenedentota bacterium]